MRKVWRQQQITRMNKMIFGKKEKYTKTAKSIIDFVKCPYTVFPEGTDEKKIIKAYMEALERGTREGFQPVLVPSDEILAEWFSYDDCSRAEILASTMSGEEFLRDSYEENIEFLEEEWEELSEKEWRGELKNEEINTFSGFMDLKRKTLETILFEIPVKNPWEVIAYLPFGGWNECPAPEYMMGVCRYWYEEYGAVPAVISHDTMEFYVEKPIDSEEKAWKVAEEHWAFDDDRVFQCTAEGTLGEVAGGILNSKVWFFWWD